MRGRAVMVGKGRSKRHLASEDSLPSWSTMIKPGPRSGDSRTLRTISSAVVMGHPLYSNFQSSPETSASTTAGGQTSHLDIEKGGIVEAMGSKVVAWLARDVPDHSLSFVSIAQLTLSCVAMVAYQVPLGNHSAYRLREALGPLSHDEERRVYPCLPQDGQDLFSAWWVRAIVEGKGHLPLAATSVLVVAATFFHYGHILMEPSLTLAHTSVPNSALAMSARNYNFSFLMSSPDSSTLPPDSSVLLGFRRRLDPDSCTSSQSETTYEFRRNLRVHELASAQCL